MSFSATLTVNGVPEVKINMGRFIFAYNVSAVKAMESVVDLLYDESQKIVPVDTEALKKSGYKKVTSLPPVFTIGEVGYEGTTYGIYVHENPEHHHDPPTQYKFLEQPMMQGMGSGMFFKAFQQNLMAQMAAKYGIAKWMYP
jgi:hypothetical protein